MATLYGRHDSVDMYANPDACSYPNTHTPTQTPVIKLLLARGACAHIRNIDGLSATMGAAANGHLGIYVAAAAVCSSFLLLKQKIKHVASAA